ncbi:CHAP domain-containing protein [Brevundimonas sp. Root1279]|uniref:CHAP domain-containing protein n=1 Tax=Brevundimonas sp. Root1279 TaxID=1736443 RepID=UPI0007007AA3|nr:CHAP domain-containing protein [Brevundimonas sp. Root1279]KQW86391.1 amidase [Brevundimonas sp. Root1279]
MTKRFKAAAVALSLGLMALGFAPSAKAQEPYWQCVTFARMYSGIEIFGDAHTWWSQAQSRYRTGARPQMGSVLAFQSSGRMSRGHVAVVSEILTDRVIRVTHANWGGSRGKVEENVTVVDVSANGDWTAVKVWYDPINDLGTTVYPTYGFIHKAALQPTGGVLLAAAPTSSIGQP